MTITIVTLHAIKRSIDLQLWIMVSCSKYYTLQAPNNARKKILNTPGTY